jgi:hypothetical protein
MLLICEMELDLRECRYFIDCGAANDAVHTTHKHVEEPIRVTQTSPL